ncbi:hypothetical protein ACFFKC_22220 [Pseudoduganella danionis]|uniref:MerC family mercury resistance protein n=1 Tax=Pseudoduganella danionis TaxID=1890295 RepID=A0ABW9SZ24_9BURK|nr:hypothetical protein [Pseudoduganella danionis]MTW35519.1 hypothetical protein [Pseudoduganella danionis]
MYNNREIIDVVARELPVSPSRVSALPLALLIPFVAAGVAAGPATGLWSGDAAIFWLLVVGAVAIYLGINAAIGKRMSGIFAVFALAGLIGVALAVLVGGYLLPVGAVLAAIALVGLYHIARRGWEHA